MTADTIAARGRIRPRRHSLLRTPLPPTRATWVIIAVDAVWAIDSLVAAVAGWGTGLRRSRRR